MICIANAHKGVELVYVGRKSSIDKAKFTIDGSILGNPFSDRERSENIAKYKNWLWAQLGTNKDIKELMNKLAKIECLVLVCFCHPLPCHADVIRSAIEWMNKPKDLISLIGHVHGPIKITNSAGKYSSYKCAEKTCKAVAGRYEYGKFEWVEYGKLAKDPVPGFRCQVCKRPVYLSYSGFTCGEHGGCEEECEQ